MPPTEYKRNVALRLLRHKFGDVSNAVCERVEALDTDADFDAFFESLLDAGTLDDLSRPGPEPHELPP